MIAPEAKPVGAEQTQPQAETLSGTYPAVSGGCPYGSHRSLEPKGSLPQAALRLDAAAELADNELLIDVDTLNIDSASFTQIEEVCHHDLEAMKAHILGIIGERGKMHNPVTGSGGMLMGKIAKVGSALQGKQNAQGHTPVVGMRIATLVSLSLTPLEVDSIHSVNVQSDQLKVSGQAVLFESGLWAPLPDDMPEELALAALDVAGAPAQTARLVKPGDVVLVLGAGGKSGILCCYEAKKRCGPHGLVIGLERHPASSQELKSLGLCHHILDVDAKDPVAVLKAVQAVTQGREVDLAINCVNITGTEMSSVLPVRQGGMVYFFSMATSFTAAALGAEGLGKDVQLLIGNGFAKSHDLTTLDILRESKPMFELFQRRYLAKV
jgi:L-erythro-3,5-diaminohexanoate dehydrogenase